MNICLTFDYNYNMIKLYDIIKEGGFYEGWNAKRKTGT